MKRTILLAGFALITACGETSGGSGRTGTGGTGGAAAPPQSVDQTCRDWCANEPEGLSCHQGPFESVQPCYESCLAAYQQEVGRECGDEWIAIKDCQLELACEDLFGDCDSAEGTFNECTQLAQADSYCASECPGQDRQECIKQYESTGTCGEPRLRNLVYCENPDVAAPSCGLSGYSTADDSALHTKLQGCASTAGCHGANAVTTWTLDLSGSVEGALTPLETVLSVNGDYLVDDLDPDCSDMLTKLTTDWGSGQRQPLAGPYWTTGEIDCFRSYLHDFSN